jgi:DNA-binding NtrC family response regulator
MSEAKCMANCRFIVCEKDASWAAALRRALGKAQPRVVETRSLAQCAAALSEAPASFVAIEATTNNIDKVMDFLSRAIAEHPHAVFVVPLAPELDSIGAAVREAGAIDAIGSVLDLPRLVRAAERHFARVRPPDLSLRESVWQQMPWAGHASAETTD